MPAYKVEETGDELIIIGMSKAKPSQTVPISGDIVKKSLPQRTHTSADGRVIGRDEAAALVMLRVGLTKIAREPVSAAGPETPARIQ